MDAQLHEVFTDLLAQWQQANQQLHESGCGLGQRVWMCPESVDDVTSPQSRAAGFQRNEIDQNYADVHKGAETGGKISAASSLKLQLDYTSVAERAFHSRHASHLRCMLHQAARSRGHAHEAGPLRGVLNLAQDLQKAASSAYV